MSIPILIQTIVLDGLILLATITAFLAVIGFIDSGIRMSRSLTMRVFVPVIPCAIIGAWLCFAPYVIVSVHPHVVNRINPQILGHWGLACFGIAALCVLTIFAMIWPSAWAASKRKVSS